jgi:hypothetical protein
MKSQSEQLRNKVSAWPQISVAPRRFGGTEFGFLTEEVGHVHTGGVVDIPFPRLFPDALLAAGLAEEHHRVRNSGWITYRMRGEQELPHALWLMRLKPTMSGRPHGREYSSRRKMTRKDKT